MLTDGSLARSLKDTVKAINSAFSSQNVSGLPEELHQTLDDFLEKRHDQDSQRVQEELLAIYNKHVGLGSGKQNAFASLLRILLPSIAKQEWLDEWWSLIVRQTLDTIGNKRDNIEAVKELLLNILVLDTAEDITTERAAGISTHFTKKTLDAFFERTKIPSSDGEVVSPEDEFIAHEWESVLIAFGRKRPKVSGPRVGVHASVAANSGSGTPPRRGRVPRQEGLSFASAVTPQQLRSPPTTTFAFGVADVDDPSPSRLFAHGHVGYRCRPGTYCAGHVHPTHHELPCQYSPETVVDVRPRALLGPVLQEDNRRSRRSSSSRGTRIQPGTREWIFRL